LLPDKEEEKAPEVEPPPAEFFFDVNALPLDHYNRFKNKMIENTKSNKKGVDISFVANLAQAEKKQKGYSNPAWEEIDMRLKETKILNEVINGSMIIAR
jgi:hypothetical protein